MNNIVKIRVWYEFQCFVVKSVYFFSSQFKRIYSMWKMKGVKFFYQFKSLFSL